jgi:hypothetical protein
MRHNQDFDSESFRELKSIAESSFSLPQPRELDRLRHPLDPAQRDFQLGVIGGKKFRGEERSIARIQLRDSCLDLLNGAHQIDVDISARD